MNKITLEIPDQLMSQLEATSEPIQTILLKALEEYLTKEKRDITKSKTWELCGSLEVTDPESEFIVHEKDEPIYTNYAENIDKILY